MSLVFVDDVVARDFAPFALTRPCCELRAGVLPIRERWELVTSEETAGFVGETHLSSFDERGAASYVTGTIPAGTILVNSRCAIGLGPFPNGDAWSCDGQVAAIRLRNAIDAKAVLAAERFEALQPVKNAVPIEGRWVDQVWDLVRHLTDLLTADITTLGERVERTSVPAGVTTAGMHLTYLERGATIEPMVHLDASAGPIFIRRGAHINAFTRIVGPCFIGKHTIVSGGRVAACSIGEHCRVHGEVAVSVFSGYTNKAHDGFIGHSVLGRWVNLGASTVNSNLKNNYTDVSFWTPRGVERTGMQFLGAFLGDHAKTAIGTRLTTGAVIGAGANVYGTGMTPRYVPPFAWGLEGTETWELDAFLQTAERVMKRRDVVLSERTKRQLTAAWQRAVGDTR